MQILLICTIQNVQREITRFYKWTLGLLDKKKTFIFLCLKVAKKPYLHQLSCEILDKHLPEPHAKCLTVVSVDCAS